jgi:hypothetical protein
MIASGMSDKEAAQELGISVKTLRQRLDESEVRILGAFPALRTSGGTGPRQVILKFYRACYRSSGVWASEVAA